MCNANRIRVVPRKTVMKNKIMMFIVEKITQSVLLMNGLCIAKIE